MGDLTYKEKLESIQSFVKQLGYEDETEETAIEILKILNEKSLNKLSKEFACDDVRF